MYRLAVIGAGPAGLMAAISAARQAAKLSIPIHIDILEKTGRAGNKLLISGSGQCNVTNMGITEENPRENASSFLSHYGSRRQGNFLKKAYFGFSNRDSVKLFSSLGVPMSTRDDGKVFPSSFKAMDIQEALVSSATESGITILTNCRVKHIQQVRNFPDDKDQVNKLRLLCPDIRQTPFTYDAVIIATGGMSYPATGSSGDGYFLARELGHSVTDLVPALSGITIRDHSLSALSGISMENIPLSIWRDNRKVLSFEGDLLITHTGFSGPVVVNNSRSIRRLDEVSFDVTRMGIEAGTRRIRELVSESGSRQVIHALKEFSIPRSLFELLLANAGISPADRCSDTGRNKVKKLGGFLTDWRHIVASPGKFTTAMATAGGVTLSEVSPDTMQSRLVPSLFFAGEVLDIDGDTGGYNIQASLSTGNLAGKGCIGFLSRIS